MEIASGLADVALAVGVDKVGNRWAASKGGAPLVGRYLKPAVHYALLASEYLEQHDVAPETLAMVAVKNSRNGSLNPYAQRQRARTLEDVLGAPVIAGHLTSLQCCPVGEGAAAAVLVADDAIESLGLDAARCIPVVASESRSEALYDGRSFDAELTATTAQAALAEADITAEDLDVVEFHDAFSIEELQYAEAIGLAPAGKAGVALHGGEFDIGGRCAISPSGGLLSMGHPLGPTGVGQVAEIVRQLRGEAGARQQPNARYGLAHMVGLGAVCVVYVLATRASAPSG